MNELSVSSIKVVHLYALIIWVKSFESA